MRRVWVETLPAAEYAAPHVVDLLEQHELSPLFAITPSNVDVARQAMVTLSRKGISHSLWPMVEDHEGRWLSVHTHERYLAFAHHVSTTFPNAELMLDLEPPFRRTSAWFRVGHVDRDLHWKTSHAAIRTFVDRERSRGREIACTTLPFCFFEFDHAKRLSRRLGLPFFEIPWSRVNYMAYASIMEGWSLRALRRQDVLALLQQANMCLQERESLSLGLVATGAFGNEPVYRSTVELEEELALLSTRKHGVDDLALFDLGGALQRDGDWIEIFSRRKPPTHLPPEGTSPKETKRIRLLRQIVGSLFETKRRISG